MSSSPDTFRDDASRQDKGEGFNTKFAVLAFGLMAIIFGTIIGVLVTRNNSLDTTDPTEAPVAAPDTNGTVIVESGGPATTVDLDCAKMEKPFSTKSIVLTMSVSSTISAVEIDYAANTFEKTYSAMLSNQLEAAQEDFCDPFCRTISAVTVDSNSLMGGDATAEARQSGECDSMLEMTFVVEGTFVGCEDTAFPGLFAPAARRHLRSSSFTVRSLQDAEEDMMMEEEDMEEDMMMEEEDMMMEDSMADCPVCPDDVESLGLVSPSNQMLKNVMKDFVTVLPAICNLNKVEIIPANDE